MQDVIRMTYDVALCHPDEITNLIPKSSGWLSYSQYLIRMTYRRCICHPDDLPGVGISSGWVTANSLCHPDDILFHFMSSGWLNWGWFLIRMSYGNVIMSSGWDTLPFLSHPDEIANFDFPQHAVALQRFRNSQLVIWIVIPTEGLLLKSHIPTMKQSSITWYFFIFQHSITLINNATLYRRSLMDIDIVYRGTDTH